MTLKHLYITFLTIFILIVDANNQNDYTNDSYTLLTTSKVFTVGKTVTLEFSFKDSSDVQLYCTNSYGSVLISPVVIDSILKFEIPKTVSNKSGILSWKLLSTSNTLSGQLKGIPKANINTIESYLGPPSIEAGGTDYTMLVVIPTDDLDNPLVDHTEVTIKHQFLSTNQQNNVYTKHGFAYKNINSYRQSGRIIISSECLGLNSKEYDVNAMSAIPTNFKISANRIHAYADGNQITIFKTSVIKDRFDNVVSDGTFVTFFITNDNGYKTKTSGATINGIATAKMLHPDHEAQWTIKAYVEGMANSDTISLTYKQAVSDFEVAFSKTNRIISIGPIQSFMKQRIPDGLPITLKVYKDTVLKDEIIEHSYNGFAEFNLNPDRYPNGTYNFKIETAGFSKSIANVTCK